MAHLPLSSQDRCCAHCSTVLIEAALMTEIERIDTAAWDFLCLDCDRAVRAAELAPIADNPALCDAF